MLFSFRLFCRYETVYSQDDFPVSLKLRQQIYLQAKVDSDDKTLGILADKCFATPTPNENDPKKYLILKNGWGFASLHHLYISV